MSLRFVYIMFVPVCQLPFFYTLTGETQKLATGDKCTVTLTISKAILFKPTDVLNYKAFFMIHYLFILPYMCYCVELWRSTFKATINSIVTILEQVICMIINKTDYYAHINPQIPMLRNLMTCF